MAQEIKKHPTIGFKFEAAPVVMLYGNIDTPRIAEYGGGKKSDPMFQAQFGIALDHPELATMKKALAKAAKDAFGTAEGVKFPIRMGDEMADKAKKRGKDRERCRGYVVLKATSQADFAPGMFIIKDGEVVEIEDGMRKQSAAKFYPGVQCAVEVGFKAYNGNSDPDDGPVIPNGVTAYLRSVCSTGQGKKLGNGGAARYSGFAKNVGTISDEDPTEGADF